MTAVNQLWRKGALYAIGFPSRSLHNIIITIPRGLVHFPTQMDVLVDKAPLQRRESTPACLVELARVRADIRTDGSTGMNRIGVVGPLVDKLVLLLPVSCTLT